MKSKRVKTSAKNFNPADGLPQAYLDRAKKTFAATAGASHAVLPGPLREAFADGSRTVGGHTLLPVTLGLTAILGQINSPLLDVLRIMRECMTEDVGVAGDSAEARAKAHKLRMANADQRIAEIKGDEAAAVETVFCFLTPPAELRRLLAAGRDKFRETALAALADKLHPVVLAELQRAIGVHYMASFATVVQYGAAQKEGEVFTAPPAERTTG